MLLNDFTLIASNTSRTKAYLQVMIKEDLLPAKIILYGDKDDIKNMRCGQECNGVSLEESFGKYFNRDIRLIDLCKITKADLMTVEGRDINSKEMEDAIKSLPQKYVIYSGYGGFILKPHLFKLGKQFLHVHAGILPKYRGSTTAYYSILQEGTIGATAFFLCEGIDVGDIVTQEIFGLPEPEVDVDYVYEPWTRSQVLVKALKMYVDNGHFKTEVQNQRGTTYFVIHPVLKHIALQKIVDTEEIK